MKAISGYARNATQNIIKVWALLVSPIRKENKMSKEEIPDLAKYLPDEVETADLVSKTVPPTKCVIKKGE